MAKPCILIFIDWYLPGYKAGGPIRSICSLVEKLKKDFNFFIVTTNTDFGNQTPYPSIESDKWIRMDDDVSIYYFSNEKINRNKLLQVIKSISFDIIYLNSFFSFYFSLVPLWFIKTKQIQGKCVLAPRGMLGNGALQIKKFKKKFFINLSKLIGLHKNIVWHATSQQEKEEITSVFGKAIEPIVISNLSESSVFIGEAKEKQTGELKLFFLSRISQKKNLHYSLQTLLNGNFSGKIIFDIYGTLEDTVYWNKCLDLIKQFSSNIKVNYKGELLHEKVQSTIYPYHFMILNTLNENFGHSIVEALLSGCPVIISDKTPWRNLEENKAGWDISLRDEKKLIQTIQKAIDMDKEVYNLWSRLSVEYAKKYCMDESTVINYKNMFSLKG